MLSLCSKCAEPTYALKRQRGRVLKGLFPGWAPQYKGWKLGQLRNLTNAELFRLAKRGLKAPLRANTDPQVEWKPVWGESWSETQLLARYGLDAHMLSELMAQQRLRKSRDCDSDSDC